MRNNITISEDYIAGITQESGANSTIVTFLNISSTNTQLELYMGNEFYGMLACRNANGNVSATLPAEVFTGNNIHFRLIINDVPNQFFHIIYDPENDYIFKQYNDVVCGNKNFAGTSSSTGSNYNTYDDLAEFENSYLRNNSYSELRSKKL